ncbi:cytochrome c oxidase subunit II [Sphingomonas sp. CGMCC 1.13654]|uniref:cytochrome-c oxidase n=1 Tax=Sphingomonas chungangi TaxID=2683589 RepID=A0A838LAE6_9SPHN|nr:cytochrome c oxidase subunit II [Sphingomonas chungangi]MBA2935559.1 cytochrome c oxidase subunit II [Sphingomonas chungangi]MVW54252.1 cytochrome c oxidase subunit II [Sphingomonas chungangi]
MLPEASTLAPAVDRIFWGLVGLSVVIMGVVGGLVLTFAIKYRRGTKAYRGPLPDIMSREVEIGWTVATLFVALFIFWWAAAAQLPHFLLPKKALEIHVVAKQWMWKVQHPEGVREIDALHVPVGVPVKLEMTSQDVIHSFGVPAFRIKQDVLPGRYTSTWFEAKEVGDYHLFCTEYCGTDHARMTGTITVMEPEAYARWLAEQPHGEDLAGEGAQLFTALGCSACHGAQARVPAPSLANLYGSQVVLADGSRVTADEDYLRESIERPEAKVTAGYPSTMPSYQGIASEEQVVALVAYIKSQDGKRSQAR